MPALYNVLSKIGLGVFVHVCVCVFSVHRLRDMSYACSNRLCTSECRAYRCTSS